MPVTYRVSPEHRLLETRLEGRITVAEIVAYTRELETVPGYRGDFDAIIDVRGVTSLLGTDELRQLGAAVRDRDPSLASRRAIVTGEQDVVYGLVRQFESYAEGGPASYRAFRRLADAVAWIGRTAAALRYVHEGDLAPPAAAPGRSRDAEARDPG